jgi:hypothetical protein
MFLQTFSVTLHGFDNSTKGHNQPFLNSFQPSPASLPSSRSKPSASAARSNALTLRRFSTDAPFAGDRWPSAKMDTFSRVRPRSANAASSPRSSVRSRLRRPPLSVLRDAGAREGVREGAGGAGACVAEAMREVERTRSLTAPMSELKREVERRRWVAGSDDGHSCSLLPSKPGGEEGSSA